MFPHFKWKWIELLKFVWNVLPSNWPKITFNVTNAEFARKASNRRVSTLLDLFKLGIPLERSYLSVFVVWNMDYFIFWLVKGESVIICPTVKLSQTLLKYRFILFVAYFSPEFHIFRCEVNQSVRGDLIPNSLSLVIRHMWLTLSKAFEKSRHITSTFALRPRMVVHLSYAASRLVIQEWPSLKPCCSSKKKFIGSE